MLLPVAIRTELVSLGVLWCRERTVFRTIIEPFRIHSVEPLQLTTR